MNNESRIVVGIDIGGSKIAKVWSMLKVRFSSETEPRC
jgi:hypothetical protein